MTTANVIRVIALVNVTHVNAILAIAPKRTTAQVVARKSRNLISQNMARVKWTHSRGSEWQLLPVLRWDQLFTSSHRINNH